jgi:hypothetical protein
VPSVPTELQYFRLCDLISGLPQIQWFVYELEMTGDYLFIRARSIQSAESTSLFIIDAQGDFV